MSGSISGKPADTDKIHKMIEALNASSFVFF